MRSEHTPLLLREFMSVMADYAELLSKPGEFKKLVNESASKLEELEKRSAKALEYISATERLQAEMSAREAVVKENLAEIQAREIKLSGEREAFGRQMEELNERGRKANALQDSLNSLQDGLVQREKSVAEKAVALGIAQAEVEAKEAHLDAQNSAVEEEWRKLEAEKATGLKAIENTRHSLEEKEKTVDEQRRELRNRSEALTVSEKSIKAREAVQDELERRVKKLTRIIKERDPSFSEE